MDKNVYYLHKNSYNKTITESENIDDCSWFFLKRSNLLFKEDSGNFVLIAALQHFHSNLTLKQNDLKEILLQEIFKEYFQRPTFSGVQKDICRKN